MKKGFANPATNMLASVAANLEADYEIKDDPWSESPFAWIKKKPSGQVGKIGVQLMSA